MRISISNLENTQSYLISQENYSHSQDIPLSSKILEDLFSLKANGKRTSIANAMNELLYRYNMGKSLHVSHQTLATKVGVTRTHFIDIMCDLEEAGCVTVERRYHQNNTYYINPVFFEKENRLALKHLLPELDDTKISRRKWYASVVANARSVAMSHPEIRHSLYGINYINAHEDTCDDGAILNSEEEPDWLVAAGQPIGSSYCIFEKNNLENQKTANLVTSFSSCSPFSLNSFKKSSSNTAEPQEVTGMEDNLYEQIIPVAALLKSIRPTKWGQIKLSAFSDEAILYADSRMLKTATAVSDKFKYFVKICKLHSEQDQLPINWSTMIELGAKHKMQDEHIWLDESFIPKKAVANPVKRSNSSSINYYEHNQAIIRELAPHLLDIPKQKHGWEAELEELKTTDPKRYEWRKKYQQDLLLQFGRDPITGDALPHFNQAEAAAVLNNVLGGNLVNSKSDFQSAQISPKHVAAQYIESLVEEDYSSDIDVDYSSDPFGDFK